MNNGTVHVFHRKTGTNCPICGSPMYMIYWRDKSRSFACLKCYFGFNYKN